MMQKNLNSWSVPVAERILKNLSLFKYIIILIIMENAQSNRQAYDWISY